MKRLIAILIAILTLLFGGIRQAEEELPAADTATEETETVRFVDTVSESEIETAPVTEEPTAETDLPAEPSLETEQTAGLSTEKEICEPVTETETVEPDEPIVTEADSTPFTDTPTPSFQQAEPETDAAEETTVTAEPPVTAEQQEETLPTPAPTTDEPVTVITEKTGQTPPEKEETEIPTDDTAPVFIDPCQGGPNPFDDDTPTEIDDHSSDEFIGEDDDRPGEGIHF